ncbi:MAG: hypothetical protein IT385_12320 [Deltaproteobacteria bacterium]|nr:hypothetical protein [Deltaproteobacteria bacterium]
MKAPWVMLLALTVGEARAGVVIDHVDDTGIDDEGGGTYGRLVLYVDVREDDGRPVFFLPEPDGLALTIDGRPLVGDFDVTSAHEARLPMALGVLLSAHSGLALPSPERDVDPFAEQKAGFATLVKLLSDDDELHRVAAWMSTDLGPVEVAGWGAPSSVGTRLATLLRPEVRPDAPPPDLYGALATALDRFSADQDDLPRRRVLIVLSDGLDARPETADARVDALAERARLLGVRILTLGFSSGGEPTGLVRLAALARKTGGHHRSVFYAQRERLAGIIGLEGRALGEQLVVSFRPRERWYEPLVGELRLRLATPDGRRAFGRVEGARIRAFVDEREGVLPRLLLGVGIGFALAGLGVWLMARRAGKAG